ncbi:MAG: phage tail protein [Collinsella sp.]|nr:phage tail protein [Collinsella sp.]
MRVDVYSRHDAYVGTIGARQLLSFIWTDCLNGEDTVDITTTYPLKEGYRLVWQDLNGEPHEHVCQDPKGASAAGLPIYSDTALNSICELFGDYIEDKRPYGYSFQRALEVCLEPTRWEVGTVDQPGTVSGGLTFYHTDCRSALNSILECGGELQTSITVGADGVTHRRVSILKHRGEANGHRRFSYGKDINSITRTEHWGAITACYGYGKGVETDSGGYGRKLTFGEINNGKDYVEDAEALKLYGRPDGKGGLKHVFGKYENSSCEDAHQLKDETQDYLNQHKTPGVTYEADVVDLVAMGRPWEGVGVGDDTQMVDSSFEPTLRCQGRVTKLVSDLLAKTQSVTLGNVTESIADILQQQQQQISNLQNQSGSWDAVAGTTPAFLQQLIDSLNEQFNMNGMSYMHVSYQNGFIFSSVPLDEDGRPTATGGTAMQLCSLGFRIAAGTKADGSYDWRTFGTGNGFVADWITTGTLMANLIKAGRMVVGDPNDPVFMVDFDSKDVVISATASVGNSSAGDIVVSADVQYGLSDSSTVQPTTWSTTALWAQGKHLWTRVKMELADGTIEYTTPRRIANESGIGAAEVIEQYYLSTSSTTQTGGYWSNTQPAWVSGRYYWTRSRIKWSNGTYTYTDPVLARGLTSGNQSTDNLDNSLTQREVFNRLTNNGQTQGVYLSNSKLYINASYIATGTISDATGKNYWNLSSGYLRTTSGYIGGLTIENSYVGNSVFRLTNSGIHFYYSNYELGKIGTNSYTGDSSKRGLVFDLENEGSYMTWAVAESASASTYTMKLSYINQAFGGFSTDTIALGCDLDGRNYTAHNFYIDPDSGGASGGITNTLSGMLPKSINSDGTVAHWTTNVRLQFKRGLLVGMYS